MKFIASFMVGVSLFFMLQGTPESQKQYQNILDLMPVIEYLIKSTPRREENPY